MITPEQIIAARKLLRWNPSRLAAKARISTLMVHKAEDHRKDACTLATLSKIQAAFEKAGITFAAENGRGPGVRLEKEPGQAAKHVDVHSEPQETRADHIPASTDMITAAQFKAGRELLEWSRDKLAGEAGVSTTTVRLAETWARDVYVSDALLAKIQAALVTAGVEFTDGDEPGVRMKKAEA